MTRGITRPSAYLLAMPRRVLFGKAAVIEKWCAERTKVSPTLLDLDLARRQMKKENRRHEDARD